MGKRYVAEGSFRGNHPVLVYEDSGKVAMLRHHVHHSPSGHSWGYGGSGPSELAKDVLWDVLGHEPDPVMYQQFKVDVIANIPQNEGFALNEADVLKWLEQYAYYV